MKKLFIAFILLCCHFLLHAQTDFENIDALARSMRKSQFDTPEALAKALCKDLKTDRDKARAIFTWIADNVRYDFKSMDFVPPKGMSRAELEAMRIERTYKKGKGVCEDYSVLYKHMAGAVGLECVLVSGNSRSLMSSTLGDHAWNAVKIDGKWQLLDATWGAGYVEGGDDFNQVFQPGYFFTDPRIFAVNHFPKEEKWQLLDTPLAKEAFKIRPVFSYGIPELGVLDIQPFGSALTRGADGKVEVRLRFLQAPEVIRLKMGNREILLFDRSEPDPDGWVTLRFHAGNGRELQVWGGEQTKKGVHTRLLGVFPVKS
jgi:hypothetical protein